MRARPATRWKHDLLLLLRRKEAAGFLLLAGHSQITQRDRNADARGLQSPLSLRGYRDELLFHRLLIRALWVDLFGSVIDEVRERRFAVRVAEID